MSVVLLIKLLVQTDHLDDTSSPGPIHMDNVFCVGTESALFDCSFNGFDNHNCRHSEDAGVICSSEFTE